MEAPDGTVHAVQGVYREIVEPERLGFTHAWEDDNGRPGHETLVTVALTTEGDETALTFRQEGLASVDSRDAHADGWNGVLEKLAKHLRSSGASSGTPAEDD